MGRMYSSTRRSAVLALCVVPIFLASAVSKALDTSASAQALIKAGFGTRARAPLVAVAAIASEAGLALALLVPRFRTGAFVIVLFLSIWFSGLHAYLFAAGELASCGCFAGLLDFSGRFVHLIMLAVTVALAGCALLYLLPLAKSPDPAP